VGWDGVGGARPQVTGGVVRNLLFQNFVKFRPFSTKFATKTQQNHSRCEDVRLKMNDVRKPRTINNYFRNMSLRISRLGRLRCFSISIAQESIHRIQIGTGARLDDIGARAFAGDQFAVSKVNLESDLTQSIFAL
jgi:hypothetical protein